MATKKSGTRKSTPKTTKRKVTKKNAPMQSFQMTKDQPPFKTFKVTKQTVYWSILLLVIIVTQLWILKLQMDVVALTDAMLTH